MSEEVKVDPDFELLKKHCGLIGEHFDTVRIFVTKHDSATDETSELSAGLGNMMAQEGQVRIWVKRMDEYNRVDARRRCREDSEDE